MDARIFLCKQRPEKGHGKRCGYVLLCFFFTLCLFPFFFFFTTDKEAGAG